MVLTGILRHYLSVLLQTVPKPLTPPKSRESLHLLHTQYLRSPGNASALPSSTSFAPRKSYTMERIAEGSWLADPENRGKAKPNMMTDPSQMEGMMGMMKGSVAMMVPQTVIMGWINAFFAGFVLLKLPFPLTPQFKSMLQSGVGTRDLDVRWVSSLSWYFLTLFGLSPIYNFILGSNNTASNVMVGMGGMGGSQQQQQVNPMGQQEDPDKLLKGEGENLEVFTQRWVGVGIESRILGRHGYR
ncbi:MAG: ER membrane complex subunit 3 [Chrysothrix sp. TS-e1954]|nr:MAG: ER membrane complex subunit 3 [Chrysothrix sp. TS-e1954]